MLFRSFEDIQLEVKAEAAANIFKSALNIVESVLRNKTNKNGIPDLVAIPPDSGVIFSEVKRPKGTVSKLQEYRMKELRQHGIETEVYRG